MPKQNKGTSLLIGFLDLILLTLLVYDFGFTQFNEFRNYKLIGFPLIIFLLIGFNLYKIIRYRHSADVIRRTRPNLIILLVLVVIEIVAIIINYKGSIIDTFYRNHEIIEFGLLFYFFIRLSF